MVTAQYLITTHAQAQEPLPRGHESRPFLGHHYYILTLSDQCLGVEKIFKNQFYTFYHKNTSPWDWGHEIYNFLSSYPTNATYQRLAQ